ncbi:DUF2157 domain-containing protein [Pseudomonas sp. TMP9]|uniref:DUF2157 domain-containing protein n=1 Tax=Pseudomonas sp. TMP9 TaxID=3133144 RepID=UPI0030CC32A0
MLTLSEGHRAGHHRYQQQLFKRYLAAFDIDHSLHTRQLSPVIRIASFLDALALSASVLFWLYQFWGLFSTLSQVAILITASLASFASVLFIQRRDASAYFSTLAALVAFTYFVLNVAMLGQLFSINPSINAMLP